MANSVGEDFPVQQQRVRELLDLYTELGPVGTFGAAMIRMALSRAERAAISGDVFEILRSYEELKSFKE